jgi:hypothetical protein
MKSSRTYVFARLLIAPRSPSTRRVLARHQSEPSRHVSTAREHAAVTDRGDYVAITGPMPGTVTARRHSGDCSAHAVRSRVAEMDYVHRTLRFDLLVWIGDMDDSRRRELYRQARLTLDDVAFLVIEPPDVNYSVVESRPHQNRCRGRSASPEFKHPSGRTGGHPDDLDLPRRTEHVSALLRWKRFTRMDWARSRSTLTRSAHFREPGAKITSCRRTSCLPRLCA